jgi:hypothetical protein
MNYRETPCEHSNSILFSRGYPFKCFVWIYCIEGPLTGITLDHWLYNLSEQQMMSIPDTIAIELSRVWLNANRQQNGRIIFIITAINRNFGSVN